MPFGATLIDFGGDDYRRCRALMMRRAAFIYLYRRRAYAPLPALHDAPEFTAFYAAAPRLSRLTASNADHGSAS